MTDHNSQGGAEWRGDLEDGREVLRQGFAEGFRVLKRHGTLIFKWTDTETPVSEILALTPVPPLFGHKSGKRSRTHWIVFYKGDGTHKP